MARSFDLQPYIDRLKAAQSDTDIESAHRDADQVLCDLLEALGYEKVVKDYDKVRKWYG